MTVRKFSTPLAVGLALLLAVSGVAPAGAVTAGSDSGEACTTTRAVRKPTNLGWSRTSGGEVRISWRPADSCNTGFRIHLALEHIDRQGALVVKVSANASSVVLGASTLRSLRAPIGSGRHFNVRIQAVYGSNTSVLTSSVVASAGQPNSGPAAGATPVRVAAYNLAFTPGMSSARLRAQRPRVAKQIVASHSAVVALTESVVLRGRDNTQLGSLLAQVRSAQKKTGKSASWRLTRSTRYARPGITSGGDGTRILYDAKKVKLLSSCRNTTGKLKYSSSCAIKLPRVGGGIYQRWAAIAKFQDRATGQKFWFVSVHPEVRKGGTFDRNRRAQIDKVTSTVAKKNMAHEPVVIAGDLNLSQTRSTDLSTLNSRFISRGYIDAATAKSALNLKYQTYNGWKRQVAMKSGYAGRIDHIYVRGNAYLESYKTVLSSASDHNLIRATLWLK